MSTETESIEAERQRKEKEKDVLSEICNLQKRVDKIKSISTENIALVSKLEKYYNAYASKGKDVGLDLETESIEAERQRKEKVWHAAESIEAERQREEKEQRDVYYNDVRLIRQNVQYFFWISIISIISTAIVLFVDF
tara:strand:+ start:157 stop:570 length:414 start_codon:yes stop_codon:yes gene_type:complete